MRNMTACLNLVWVCDGLVTDLVQGVRSIGDQLSQKNLLVAVESIDNETHQLLNVSIEGESLCHCCKTRGDELDTGQNLPFAGAVLPKLTNVGRGSFMSCVQLRISAFW